MYISSRVRSIHSPLDSPEILQLLCMPTRHAPHRGFEGELAHLLPTY